MPNYYSVIRYVPDPVAEEFINIGVVVFTDHPGDPVSIRFLKKWDRVQDFSDTQDLSFLYDFAQRATKAASEGYAVPGSKNKYNYQNVRGAAESWMNSIQYTSPRGSIDTLEGLLEVMTKTLLKS